MNQYVQGTREAGWPRTAREMVAKLREELRNALRIKNRDRIFESERMHQCHQRENFRHRFANGECVEINLVDRRRAK